MRQLAVLWVPLLIALGCRPDKEGQAPDTDDAIDSGEGVVGAAPAVEITSPVDGAVLSDPVAVRLQGRAEDPEDGELDGQAMAWRSDRDGDLGTGRLLTVSLSLGAHTLTLTGTDSDGRTDRDRVDVTVTSTNASPTVSILSPDPDSTILEGEALVLRGEGTDPEDGTLPGASLTWTSSLDGALGSGNSVTAPTPSLGEHLITLIGVDRAGATANQAIAVTVAGVGQNLPPTVQIAAPTQGEAFVVGTSVSLQGSAMDPEDGALTGGSLAWTSSLDGSLGTGASRTASLSQGLHTLTLTATDTLGATRTDRVDVTINPAGNTPPVATITAPTAGATLPSGTPLLLEGTGIDAEDGTLSGSALTWTSDQDGALGTGSPRTVPGLSQGRHRITLVVEDGSGALGVAATDLFVTAPNLPPTAQVLTPSTGASFEAGVPIRFEGTGTDPEDGTLSGAALRWQSSLDGLLGNGSPTMSALSAGQHTVTLTATDSGSLTASDAITLTIDPGQTPIPPNASITGSPTSSTGSTWTADASGSTDPDGTLVGYAWDFGDGTTLPSAGASTADHVFSAPGAYTVTVTVTDDDGETDSDSLTVTVTDPVRVPEVVWDGRFTAGGFCAIDLDTLDRPHVAFMDLGHDQLRYARPTGGGWTVEVVDGPGFGVGGQLETTGDLVLDDDVPHLAWIRDEALHHGERTGGTWTVERVDDDARIGGLVAIGVDRSRQDRITIGWDGAATGETVAVSWRTSGTWQTDAWNPPNTSEYRFRGGMALDSLGTWWLSTHEDDAQLVSWTPAGFGAPIDFGFSASNRRSVHPVVVDPSDEVHLAHRGGIESWDGSTPVHSDVANGPLDQVAIDWDPTADEPVAIFGNAQGNAEIVRPGPPGALWSWTYRGPMDTSPDIDLKVDSQGEVRACFFRDGNLVVY